MDGGDRLAPSCEREEVLKRQEGKEYSTYNKNKEGQLDWSHLA